MPRTDTPTYSPTVVSSCSLPASSHQLRHDLDSVRSIPSLSVDILHLDAIYFVSLATRIKLKLRPLLLFVVACIAIYRRLRPSPLDLHPPFTRFLIWDSDLPFPVS